MKNKRPPIQMIVIVLFAILIGGYYGLQNLFAEKNGGLSASGTIEVVDVDISPELAGKVSAVLAEESDTVKLGDPLLALDPSLLVAQRTVASPKWIPPKPPSILPKPITS
ncbi:MAG: biotin/lipoyl-binding protein [Planctomycetes bacterium]|nr:biotin/lipoyl-binding protein [Planctomycetota bacterium]